MNLTSVILAVLMPFAHAQEFSTSDRYGLTAVAVVNMGHDGWIRYYCDDSRRGPIGRREGEIVYCLALHDLNQAKLKTLSKSEQKMFDEVRSLFADLAKTSFVTGMNFSGHSDAWSLPIAESSTAINETIWLMLQNTRLQPKPDNVDRVWSLADQIEARGREKSPESAQESKSFRRLATRIEKQFAGRQARDVALARAFTIRMGQLALFRPA